MFVFEFRVPVYVLLYNLTWIIREIERATRWIAEGWGITKKQTYSFPFKKVEAEVFRFAK